MHYKTKELQEKLLGYIAQKMPIKAENGNTLNLEDLKFKAPDGLGDIQKQLEIKYSKNGSLEGQLRGRVVIRDKGNKIISKGNIINIIPVPYHTERGTLLVNGNEKQIISQMRLKPGSYTTSGDKGVIKSMISFAKNTNAFIPRINASYDTTNDSFKVKISSSPVLNINGIVFLREMGFSDMEIRSIIGDSVKADILLKTRAQGGKGIKNIYTSLTRKQPTTSNPELIRHDVYDFLAQNAKFGTGEKVVLNNLGLSNINEAKSLTKPVLARTFKKLFEVANRKSEPDNIDDIMYKDIYNDNDLIVEKVEQGFDRFEQQCKEILNKNSTDINARTLTPIVKLNNDVKQFISKSSLVQSPEETNPLFIASMGNKITQLSGSDGDGGLAKDSARNNNSARNLSVNGMNKIDPIETPESASTGYVQHLAVGAKIKNKTIHTPVYKVVNGKASISDKTDLSIEDDYNSYIAFNDTKYVKTNNGKLEFLAAEVPGRFRGRMTKIPVNKIEYVDSSPQNILGVTANMIPFVSHNDGARALMGTNMQKQAITLIQREAPLVSTIDANTGKTYDEMIGKEYGKPIISAIGGTVEKITDTKIFIRGEDGKLYSHQYYNYFPVNQSYINNELKVKKGDKIKKGQMIAEGWQTKDGKLALGVNTRVGYVPYKGYNYEDGVVVSESYAKKMTTDETDEVEIDIPEDWKGGKGSNVKPELNAYTTRPEVKQRLDKDGIIRKGEYVKPGQILVAALRPVNKNGSDSIIDNILSTDKEVKYQFSPFKIESTSYVEGEVKRVTVVNNPEAGISQRIIVTLVSNRPLKGGDKISGRHGNKGTITKILPDNLMPVTEDGKALELLFSPLAVPSRKNIGQVLEVNAGLIAEKTGKPYLVNNFDHTEKDKVMDKLKEIGYEDGKMKVKYKEELPGNKIVSVDMENPATVGNMYIMKLKHKADEKIQSRSNLETPPNIKDNMPTKRVGIAKGEKANPQSMGWMEMTALQGHGAAWNILESSTIKADGGGDIKQRAALFKAISTGKLDSSDMEASTTPETVKVMSDNLKALGFNVKPLNNGKPVSGFDQVYDSMAIMPVKPTEFMKMIGKENEVTNTGLYDARGLYDPGDRIKGTEKEELNSLRKGGLLDPNIFGKPDSQESRTKWGYIKLATPIVNPVLLRKNANPYTALTGMKNNDIKNIVSGNKIMVINPKEYKGLENIPKEDRSEYIKEAEEAMKESGLKPGDLVDPKKMDDLIEKHGQIFWKTGGECIQFLLDKVDLNKELKKAKEELDNATKPKAIDDSYKKFKTISNLAANDMQASDLMMHYVPVAPTYLRPAIMDKKSGRLMYDDLNKLYNNLISKNNPIKDTVDNGFDLMGSLPPVEAAKAAGGLYKKFSDITGQTVGKDFKTKRELNGVKQNIGGKFGLIRSKMLSKSVDFSGRSVIGVDPNLSLNEVGIPIDMAINMYRPFLERELVKQGYAKNAEEADDKIKNIDIDTKKVLNFIANDRPLLLNRQPTLHRLGIQALKPVIKETEDGSPVRNIHLNPLIVTAYNADFDGDTMAGHVPISEKAKEEAKRLMTPSKNLVNATNGRLVPEIRHEMALGIYQLTVSWKKPTGKAIAYNDYNRLKQDYLMGKIPSSQKVIINDPKSRQECPNGVTAGAALFNLALPSRYRKYNEIWNSKKINDMFQRMYEDAESEGWKTISTTDIANYMDKVKDIGFKASTRSTVSIGITDFKKVEQAEDIFKKHLDKAMKEESDPEKAEIKGWQAAEKEIETLLGDGKILEEDNPLNVMMASGARAKKDQIRRMMVTIGVGRDVNQNLISPIKTSHFDGLSPQDYFKLGYDSRKGITDRSVGTSAPGELTRKVWSATQDVIVKEADCKTRDGIRLKSSDNTIKGRYTLENIVNKEGKIICKKGQMITHSIANEIYADNTIKTVSVRSPLRCKTVGGVCQKCYGALSGTIQPVKIGTAVGVIASQAIGEPVTQMTMNTFHSGGSNASATLGLPRINSLLSLQEDRVNPSVLAKESGKVTDIKIEPTKTTVFINKTPHVIKHKLNGEPRKIKVHIDDVITKGDFLTFGSVNDIESRNVDDLTNIGPKNLLKARADLYSQALGNNEAQTKALHDAQDYLTTSMQYAVDETAGKGSLDRRHMETIIGKMTSKVKVSDPGDSNVLKGELVDKSFADKWNNLSTQPMNAKSVPIQSSVGRISGANYNSKGHSILKPGDTITQDIADRLILANIMDVKVLPKPIIYDAEMKTIGTIPTSGHSNWLSNLGHQNVMDQIAAGVTYGQKEKLEDPRARLMTGKLLNVGEGYDIYNKDKAKANSVGSKMLNFFSKK